MYQAIICRIKTSEHPNADRLKLGICDSFTVVVGLDTQDNELGIYFPSDGQLSESYCKANDLIGYTDPITGVKSGGYFPKSRRVRAQSFRGVKSEGYWAPLNSLEYTKADITALKAGDKLTELNGIEICNKYYTPATLKAMTGPKQTKKENQFFAKHVETEQFKYLQNIPYNAVIYMTEKLHGTSGRYGLVPTQHVLKRTWKDKLLRRTRITSRNEYQLGTRNMILQENSTGYYGSEQFRRDSVAGIKLHDGEILYYELVGYAADRPIMSDQSTTKISDKNIKKYGNSMRYAYGTEPGECKLFVYRITKVANDGSVQEYSWPQVKQRCKELDLNLVPEIEEPMCFNDWFVHTDKFEMLKELVEQKLEGPSLLDDRHIREGIVLRIESEFGTSYFKQKSFSFGVLEGFLKDKDDYVDAEETS